MQFRWSDFRLDLDTRTLERGGVPVRIQALAFDMLGLLLRNRGRVVSDAFLRRELWRGVAVSDASLRQVLKEARRAIGDDGRTQAAIETLRGRGFRFVAEIVAERGSEALFVGREDVIAVVERALDETAAGRGGVTLLGGRAGIGKTSTLLEIAARAEARGWRVLKAWARAGADADAYALWAGVADAIGASALTAASGEVGASAGISEANRFARFRALETALVGAARAQPILLCLDDLQFADRESLALLHFLAPALHATRVRVLGGHRPLSAGDPHSRDLTALAANTATHAIELRGLDAREIHSLVNGRLGAAIGAGAAEALAAQTGGSPLLALEVVRALRAGGASLERADAEQIRPNVAVGLMPLLRRRLAALDLAARPVLHAASVIGDSFDPELVRAVTQISPDELARALRDAENGALIERESEASWRFAHPLFADAVAEDLAAQGVAAAATLHLRVFEALDARGERDAFRVASHALSARDLLDASIVIDRVRRAVRAAWQMHAVGDAEIWQQRACEVAQAAALPALELSDLLRELGELQVAASGINAARPAFDRAARIAQECGDARRLTSAVLGFAHRTFALDAMEPVLAWLRVAHAKPCGDAALEARVSARLGAELQMSNPIDPSEGQRLLRNGVERARATGDALTLGRVLSDHSIAFFSATNPRAALALAAEVASCGRHAGDVEIEFRGLAEIATVRLELGDRGGVENAVADCERFAARAPLPYAQGVLHGIAAMRALLDGRLDEAASAMSAAENYGRATGSLGFGVVAGLQRFLLAREQGEGIANLLPALDQARARFPHLLGLTALAGLAHALCGNGPSAQSAADGVRGQLGRLPYDRARLATLATAAELSYLTRDAALALALDPLLSPFAALHGVIGNAASYWGSLAHALGFVAAAQGRRADAIQHFDRAQKAHEAMRSPPWARRSAQAAADVRSGARGLKLVS